MAGLLPMNTTNILFNGLKHHRGYIRRVLGDMGLEMLPDRLKVLGNSQMDIYYGQLDIPVILDEVINKVRDAGITDEASYLRWLKDKGGYIDITLSDSSRWILLHGTEPGQYIHLHPARYSPHSMRVKAAVLKTAMACMIARPDGSQPDLVTLNHIRKDILGLSPVKDLARCEHLWQVTAMLNAD
jgi:hypothetical protein